MGEARRKKLRELGEKGLQVIKIVKPHYIVSKKVKSYKEIRSKAEALKEFVDSEFTGLFKAAYSLAHCEVESVEPYAFFVINSDFMKKKVFKHRVFINPEIVNVPDKIKFEADKDNKEHENNMEIREACMMFPHRKPKRLDRPYRIEVKYQVPFFFGLFMRTVREEFEGLQSQIFQHNVEHINGKNIFFKS